MDYKYFREVQPERAIQGNFASGQINFKYDMDDRSMWNPSKSYLKIKMKLTKGDGTPLDVNFGLAPNMYICDNLFQQLDMRINGVIVSEWNDYIAQCASLKNRLYKDLNERETILSDVNYAKTNLSERINQVAADGYKKLNSGGKTRFIELKQNDDTAILTTEEIRVLVGALNVLEYRQAADAGAGAVDLTETGMKIGDMIEMVGFAGVAYFRATITAIAANTITLDRALPVAIAAEDILTNKIFLIPVDDGSIQSQRANEIELIWRPPLGIFDVNDELSGEYKFELTPHAEGVWQKYAVEALTNRAVGTTADDFAVTIQEINMYIWTCVYPSPYSGSKSLRISDMICNSQNLTTNSLTSKVFNVHAKNHSLTLAYQESSVGDDIRFSRSKFKIQNEEELNLVRYYIQKDGITLPDPIPRLEKQDSRVVANANVNGKDFMTQRYYENYAYSKGDKLLIKKEDLQEWFDAGVFFHYKWGKGYKKSDQVIVYSNFSSAFTTNPQILLFDHYWCDISMNISNGKVVDIAKS